MENFNNIIILKKKQVEQAAEMCARAFVDDLLVSYYIPNPKKRQKN